MQLLPPYRIAVAVFVLHAGPLAAQFLVKFIPIQESTAFASKNKTPVIADVELRTGSDTPWGKLTQTLTGKFWRSRDGKSRQDDTFGNTFLMSASAETWVDHEAKSAVSDVGPVRLFPNLFLLGRGPSVGKDQGLLSLGKKTIGGRAANGWREGLPGDSPGDKLYEWWTDARLGVPLEFREKGPGVESIQRLMNIEERDPDPKLFEIPGGYSVLNCAPYSQGRKPALRPAQCGTR